MVGGLELRQLVRVRLNYLKLKQIECYVSEGIEMEFYFLSVNLVVGASRLFSTG